MAKQEDILKSLIFLDIFDYPSTAMEVWRFLGVRAELSDFVIPNEAERREESVVTDYNCLTDNLISKDKVVAHIIEIDLLLALGMTNKNGFYFLNGRDDLLEKRRKFFYLAERKFKIAQKAARILRFIPGVKLSAVCNNFYYHPESDIDFFIIIQKNRMWLARALATIVLHLFRLRRHGKKIADRICLSFYITDDNLNLENLTLKKFNNKNNFGDSRVGADSLPTGQAGSQARNDKEIDDPYFCYWLAFLEPIYDAGGVYEKFWQANSWIKKIFPNIFPNITNQTKMVKDNFFSGIFKRINFWWFNSFIGGLLEFLAKKIQLKKMSLRQSNFGVIISDKILKFHENDKREYFREQLRIKREELNKCLIR